LVGGLRAVGGGIEGGGAAEGDLGGDSGLGAGRYVGLPSGASHDLQIGPGSCRSPHFGHFTPIVIGRSSGRRPIYAAHVPRRVGPRRSGETRSAPPRNLGDESSLVASKPLMPRCTRAIASMIEGTGTFARETSERAITCQTERLPPRSQAHAVRHSLAHGSQSGDDVEKRGSSTPPCYSAATVLTPRSPSGGRSC
jgi:hypothetical protein